MALDTLINHILGKVPIQVVGGTVVSVDKARAVCDVQPADEKAPALLDVQLRAVDDGSAAGFVLWPVVDSPVLVGLIENDPNNCFVVAVSQVEAFTLSTTTDSLAQLFADLFTALAQLTVQTGTGASSPPINLLDFQQLAQRAATFFRA